MRTPLAMTSLVLAALIAAPIATMASVVTAPAGYGLLQAARHGAYLSAGSAGMAVAALQRALSAAGVAVAETASFDAATEAAVRSFQAAHGAGVADGVVGPHTLAALDSVLGLPLNGVPLKGTNVPPPPGYRGLSGAVPAAVTAKAVAILNGHDPIGTQMEVGVGGVDYVFAVEWHKHAATDHVPPALKQWHRGVTVYKHR